MQEITVGSTHSPSFLYPESLLNNVNAVIEDNVNNPYPGVEGNMTDGKYDYDKNMSMAGRGTLIIYIRHLTRDGFLSRFSPVKCFEGTQEAELAMGLNKVSNYVFSKHSGDAFSNPELESFIRDSGITDIEIVGVDGGGCVSMTALGALKRGYKVTLNLPAIGTMNIKRRDKFFAQLRRGGALFIQ
jgi:nicotinamidase-related amidase